MSTRERANITMSSAGPHSREQSLVPMGNNTTVKGGIISSATSTASSDNTGDSHERNVSGDGALDRLRSRGSEDGHSEGSSHRRHISKLFKGRRNGGRRKSALEDDSSLPDLTDDLPAVPYTKRQGDEGLFDSEESLGLHKEVPSSLLVEDSDADGYVAFISLFHLFFSVM
jgi:hypothetical protein